MKPKKPRGFAAMSPERQRELAAAGGRASSGNFAKDRKRASADGRKGGRVSGGNFAKDPARAAEAGRKGGLKSRGNFKHNRARAAEIGRKGGAARAAKRSP